MRRRTALMLTIRSPVPTGVGAAAAGAAAHGPTVLLLSLSSTRRSVRRAVVERRHLLPREDVLQGLVAVHSYCMIALVRSFARSFVNTERERYANGL